ncbi:GTP-dependent dephospho-CoA kinase family protein [Halomicrobium katesii]|uniref:GTP-dependent dephospho-CoA kinase family protein n=1 Tax=Halomicrobium katesii TaxID=437163 RepID=UPI000378A4FB|nr:GTP-dependent dephospho-CoA kinase family protein [Halomicrobium katesii]
MSSLRLDLPSSLRHELKEPLGPIYTDADELLTVAAEPIVAVGDIVTYHLLEAGYTPAVAFVDDRTKRTAVDPEVRDAVGGFDHCRTVDNPAGTITGPLIGALSRGLGEDGTTLIRVDGEEDLAALPAVLAVPEGASVVYGQPDEGMVLVTADAAARERCRDLIGRMDGPADELLAALS